MKNDIVTETMNISFETSLMMCLNQKRIETF
jgi:hypothetical protein